MTRIGVGGIFIECNHFAGHLADLSAFERSELLCGEELAAKNTGVIGGMVSVLEQEDCEPVPLLYASACPGGMVEARTYEKLKGELLSLLANADELDGILLCLHGAGSAQNAPDLEGDLVHAVRELVGDSVPIVATLDLHAHVTPELLTNADVLLAWETYPHADAFETGQRGARAIVDILAGRLNPVMAMAKVPVVVSAINGRTRLPGPFAEIMNEAKRVERQRDLYSVNPILVHPYLDQPDMGGGVMVVANGNLAEAISTAQSLAEQYWEKRFAFQANTLSPREAIRRGSQLEGGPVLLVETADCCGGGAAGDSVHSLRALLEIAPDSPAIVPVVDPIAAQMACDAGAGRRLIIRLGHQVDPQWGEPINVEGVVSRLSDGRFTYRGGIWDGRSGCMGPSAVFEIGPIQVLISSYATYDWKTEQLDRLELDIPESKFIVVKNPMNYQQAYAEVMKAALILDTPGPTPVNTNSLTYTKMNSQWFPKDWTMMNTKPVVMSSTARYSPS
mgnify:FL=1